MVEFILSDTEKGGGNMAKFLFISAPFSGHTNPTLPLVAEIVRRRHDVAFINAPKWQNKIENIGAEFIPTLI